MLSPIRRNIIFVSIAVSVLYLTFKLSTWEYQVETHHFTMRDFLRAQSLFKGELIWFGPELNFGGYLPGPAFYYLLLIPLLFTQSIVGMVFLAYALAAIAAGVMLYHMLRHHGKYSAIIALILFVNSEVYNSELYKLWNPSFTIVINFLLVSLLLGFLKYKEKKLLYWSALIIGVGIQIHLSVMFHWLTILTILFMQFFQSGGLKEISKTLMKAILIFMLPLIPYLIWTYSTQSLETLQVLSESQSQFFDFIRTADEILDRLFEVGPIWGVVLALSVFLVIRLRLFGDSRNDFKKKFFFIFLIHVLVNLPLALAQDRYLLPYQAYAIVFYSSIMGLAFEEASKRARTFFKYRKVIFCFISILALLDGLKGSYSRFKAMRVDASYSLGNVRDNFWTHLLSDYMKIVNKVYREKKWSPEEFEDRIYHFVSSSFEIGNLYRNLYNRNMPRDSIEASYDGLIIFPISGKFKGDDFEWFRLVGVPRNTMTFFNEENIEIVESQLYHNIKVLFYKLKPNVSKEEVPHNMGVTYFVREAERYINNASVDFGQIELMDGLKENQKLIVWDFKKFYEWPRRIGLYVDTEKVEKDFLSIQLTLDSHLLRLTFPSQDNFLDQLFIGGMKVKLKGSSLERELVFPSILGDPKVPFRVRLKYEASLFGANLEGVGELPINSTPVFRNALWPCSDELLEIEILIDDLLIMRNRSSVIEEYWKDTRRSISLPDGFIASECSF